MTEPRPILVLGSRGQVGFELVRLLAPLAPLMAYDSAALDITDAVALRAAVDTLRPRAIVNAAAYTAVDAAEDEPARAMAVNAEAPAQLAELAAARDICLVHYSTDYVFDGSAGEPYRESDATAPLGVYGSSKLAGERAILDSSAAAIILRTSWVYGLRARNFLLTMQRLARAGKPLRIVADQWGAPTWSRLIAATTAAILSRCNVSAAALREHRGLYHLSAAGATTWYDFARRIVAATPGAVDITVEPITTAQYPTPARRPPYSVLDCTRLCETFGLWLPHWEEQLDLVLAEQSAGI